MYYINYFFIYSFLGYLYECFLGLIKDDKVGSGILYGPVTPVLWSWRFTYTNCV